LKVTLYVVEELEASEVTVHSATFPDHAPLPLAETGDKPDGSAMATDRDLALAGPAFCTVKVQLAETSMVTLVGHTSVAVRSASLDEGVAATIVSVNGPAVADPTLLEAITS
jgi:hypothetical protein